MTMEEFKFRVKRAFYVTPRKWWSLDGTLEAGLRISVGDEGVIESDPALKVTITAIPIVTGAKDELLTICIAEPAFPAGKLEGALIVGVHRPKS